MSWYLNINFNEIVSENDRDFLALCEEIIGIKIPDWEIEFIALHVHLARNNGKLSNTIKYTYIGNTITEYVEYVEYALNIEIDRKSLDYARFLIYMRFAIERIMKKSLIKNDLLYNKR